MIKKSIVVTIIFIISTFIQLISQIVVTRIFGASMDLDMFLAAVTIPTIIVTVIYGTLNDAFLPLYGEIHQKDNAEGRNYFISTVITLTGISFMIASVFSLFSASISHLLYESRGEEFVRSVGIQMSYMSLSLPLSVIVTLFGSYFYTHKRFFRFPIAQLVGSVVNVGIIFLLSSSLGIWSLIIAFVFNIMIQIFFVIPPVELFKEFRVIKLFNMTYLIPLLWAWIPLMIGSFALRSDILLIRSMGSHLPSGYLVYLNLISKLFSLSTSVMTIGIQIVLLPHLVEYMAAKNYEKAIQDVSKAKLGAVLISLCVTISLILVAPFLIKLLFVGGKFTSVDADITITLLPLFILPSIGWGINSVFFQPLLALKKQLQLGLLYIVALVLGWGMGTLITNSIDPLLGITSGLIVMLFTGIIGSEILWQYYKKKLIYIHHERNSSI